MKFLNYAGLTKLIRLIKDKYAPLVSPTLTGIPTAPTAELGTNTSQVATTEFVQDAIDAYVPDIDKISHEDIADAWGNIDPANDIPDGEYNKIDLAGYATEAYVRAAIEDYNEISLYWDYIQNKPIFATVATSGNYNDLFGKPEIPVVPTNVSAFTNDSHYATESYVNSMVTTNTGNKININSENYIKGATVNNNTLTLTKGNNTTVVYTPVFNPVIGWNDIPDKPAFAIVATSGNYNDLLNKPTIPTNISAFTNDSSYATETYVNTAVATNTNNKLSTNSENYIKSAAVNNNTLTLTKGNNTTIVYTPIVAASTHWNDIPDKPAFASVATSGSYNDLSNKPTIPEVPTNLSAFTNDTNYATESYIDTAIANSANDKIDTNSENYIKSASVSNNTLTLTKGNDTTISYTPMVASSTSWVDIPDKPTFATVATSGNYNDLSNKPTIPTIPTAISAFTNDSDYATEIYVNTAISNLVNSAPATLDTLNELASALGNDPNFATTVANNIGNKVSIDSANYIKSAAVNNNTLTLTQGNNTTVTFTKMIYDAMTAAQATAGTSTDAVLISPKVLADYISSRVINLNYLSTSGGTVNGNITLGNDGHIILSSGIEIY